MSVLFGPAVQQGYVVPDLRSAMRHWLARGVGPFFFEELRDYSGIHDGMEIRLDLDAGFAYSGDQQIEVIQPLGSATSIYSRFLEEHPRGGLQHLAFWVDDIDETLERIERIGKRYVVAQRYGDRHAYLDSVEAPGVMIQLMAHSDTNDELFRIVRKASRSWDGETNPIRKIDWSSGRPIAPDD